MRENGNDGGRSLDEALAMAVLGSHGVHGTGQTSSAIFFAMNSDVAIFFQEWVSLCGLLFY